MNAYIIGYVVCLLGLSVSIGFLVDALNKKKTETDDAKKTKLTGQAVGGGFGIAFSIITAIVIMYFHYNDNESSEYKPTQYEDFNTSAKKQIANDIIDLEDKSDVNRINRLCNELFSDDQSKLDAYNDVAYDQDPSKRYYAYQSCIGAAAAISGRNVPASTQTMQRLKEESAAYMRNRY